MEQPVKPNVGQYKIQPGRIEHFTPGKSSVSDKEAKQVNNSLSVYQPKFFFLCINLQIYLLTSDCNQ